MISFGASTKENRQLLIVRLREIRKQSAAQSRPAKCSFQHDVFTGREATLGDGIDDDRGPRVHQCRHFARHHPPTICQFDTEQVVVETPFESVAQQVVLDSVRVDDAPPLPCQLPAFDTRAFPAAGGPAVASAKSCRPIATSVCSARYRSTTVLRVVLRESPSRARPRCA